MPTPGAPWPTKMRAIRSFRPPRAEKGKRAETFAAGLEQAEQLWEAAAAVSPVASPLLLFYGLCQAGRALCASHTSGPGWEPTSGHGLQFQCEQPASTNVLDLGKATISAHGDGLVQRVAAIRESPVLAASTSLAALTRSCGLPAISETADPCPLNVSVEWCGSNALIPAPVNVVVWPIPVEWSERTEPYQFLDQTHTKRLSPGQAELFHWLAPYPKLATYATSASIGAPDPLIEDRRPGEPVSNWLLRLRSPEPISYNEYYDWGRNMLDIDESRVGNGPSGECLPLIAGNSRPQDRLVTWWLVLYGFSMLARYFPAIWTKLLDIDVTPSGVIIEHILQAAAQDVPELLFSALTSGSE